ncbi:hypothetical protein EJ02DRAFT_269609 [Clathrospora elynae]|uniref:Uncharacterized protein n=1 Tax=Clathrospora elynae TaxID=706981 RepID=A0A6A5SH02_9PLEO|nr:hypothetical protein EJ02DRAFT_269609 [Clathrospora elynae]
MSAQYHEVLGVQGSLFLLLLHVMISLHDSSSRYRRTSSHRGQALKVGRSLTVKKCTSYLQIFNALFPLLIGQVSHHSCTLSRYVPKIARLTCSL